MSDCGGCSGLGSHRRWCSAVVGLAASQWGKMSEEADSLGDRIGGNAPHVANMAYTLASELLLRATEAKARFQSQQSPR